MRKCIDCGIDITVGSKTGYCRKCSRKHFPVWNKGLTKNERPQMSRSGVKLGNKPYNINSKTTQEQKIKISCKLRDIPISEFKEFSMPLSKRERAKFDDSKVKQKCFERDDWTCQAYGIKGVRLNAHHIESWSSNKELRFDIDNLITLSDHAHKTFHSIYGSKTATKEDLEEFISSIKTANKKTLHVITGAPGAGKSWVCKQLEDIYSYHKYDSSKKFKHVYNMIIDNDCKPLLYDIVTNVSTFIKHNKDVFNIEFVVIREDEAVVNSRLIGRGGKITDSVKKRVKRMKVLSKRAKFSGTSSEVLEYLRQCQSLP